LLVPLVSFVLSGGVGKLYKGVSGSGLDGTNEKFLLHLSASTK